MNASDIRKLLEGVGINGSEERIDTNYLKHHTSSGSITNNHNRKHKRMRIHKSASSNDETHFIK